MTQISLGQVFDLFPSIKRFFELVAKVPPETYSDDEQSDSEFLLASTILNMLLNESMVIPVEPDLVDRIAISLETVGSIDDVGMAEFLRTSLQWKSLFKE